jgi:hypothetical protein
MPKAKSTTKYVVRVTLKGRGIWRTVVVRGDHTLDELHEAIFGAFNRFDDHL